MTRDDYRKLNAELAKAGRPTFIVEHPEVTPGRRRKQSDQRRYQLSAMRAAAAKAKRQGCSDREIMRRLVQTAGSFHG
jgi:hypothetical protein